MRYVYVLIPDVYIYGASIIGAVIVGIVIYTPMSFPTTFYKGPLLINLDSAEDAEGNGIVPLALTINGAPGPIEVYGL